MPGRFANLEFEGHQEEAGHVHPEALGSSHRPQRETESALVRAEHEYRWGRFEPALRLYTRALREDRTTIRAWVGQVQMLVQLDECHEARIWSDKGLEVFRDNGELLAAKAQACARLNDLKSASACCDASLAAPGSSPWRWIVRGEVLLARRQNFADECFQKAITETTAGWFDHVVIARIYMYYRRFSSALYCLKQALELEQTNGYLWFEMGNCQHATGFAAAAAQSYCRCLELRPDYTAARQALHSVPLNPPLWTRLRGLLTRWRRS